MDGISTERAIVTGAVSAELDSAFRTVADADLGAGPKYAPRIMRALARTVTARAYGKPMLELCHLLRIADVCGGRHGWPALIFGVQVARSSAFRAQIQDAARRSTAFGAEFELAAGGVAIHYGDAEFTVAYGRMGFLAALLELIVTAIGYRAVDAVIREWLDDRFEASRAAVHANALSRLFYEHLKDHLTPAQSLRVFARLIGFLEADRGRGFVLDDIDDRAVFDYWHRSATQGEEDGGELRGFRAVTERMGMLRTALEVAFERHAVTSASPIGPERERGEVDPETVLHALESQDEPADELRALGEPPAAQVKFLTAKEASELDLTVRLGRHAPVLALSILRVATFGAVQNRLSQALRRRAAERELAALIACEGCETYEARIDHWRALEARLDRMALAALAVLTDAGRPEAALEVLARRPDADLTGLRGRLAPAIAGDNVGALHPAAGAGLTTALGDASVTGAEVAALIADARKALRGLGRTGFAPEDRAAPGVADGMAAGAPLVRRLIARLVQVRSAADSRAGPHAFDADRARFRDGFLALYGAAT
jgi:hypothetical protein